MPENVYQFKGEISVTIAYWSELFSKLGWKKESIEKFSSQLRSVLEARTVSHPVSIDNARKTVEFVKRSANILHFGLFVWTTLNYKYEPDEILSEAMSGIEEGRIIPLQIGMSILPGCIIGNPEGNIIYKVQ